MGGWDPKLRPKKEGWTEGKKNKKDAVLGVVCVVCPPLELGVVGP